MLGVLIPIWILAGLVTGYFGIEYLAASSGTNSAIHQTLGVLGLGLAFLFVGQAALMGAINGLSERQRQAVKAVDGAANAAMLSAIPGPVRAATVLLRSLADSGGRRTDKHNKRIVEFVSAALEQGGFSEAQRSAVLGWVFQLNSGSSNIESALNEIHKLNGSQRDAFASASQAIIRGGRRDGADRQRWLLEEIRSALGTPPDR